MPDMCPAFACLCSDGASQGYMVQAYYCYASGAQLQFVELWEQLPQNLPRGKVTVKAGRTTAKHLCHTARNTSVFSIFAAVRSGIAVVLH